MRTERGRSRGRTISIDPPSPSSYSIGEAQLIGAAEIAAGLDQKDAAQLLAAIGRAKSPRAALLAVRKLVDLDRILAGKLARGIAASLKGPDAIRIEGLANSLLAAAARRTR